MTDIMAGPMRQLSTGSTEEVQMDSIVAHRADQLRRTEETLLEQLINIDEEMGTDDLELLKFLCRDHIGVSKLESMISSLEVFHQLQKLLLIKPDDVDFLIECLGLIHRIDLLRKLGFDSTHIENIKENFSGYTRISSFRKLLLAVAEDLDDIELNKMKFLLSGMVRKRRLQDHKTVLDLFVYMEQEHMLTHAKTELLVDILKNIKRMDLVHKIQAYAGRGTRPTTESQQLHMRPSQRVPETPHTGVIHGVNNRVVPEPRMEHELPARSAPNAPLNREPGNVAVNRSPSAGTLSVSSSEGNLQRHEEDWKIPTLIIDEIVQTVVRENQWTDFGMELGFTNEEIGVYETAYTDRLACVRKALDDWSAKLQTTREIAPKLLYVLGTLNLKTLKEKLLKWQELSASAQRSQGQGQGHVVATSTERAPRVGTGRVEQNINYTVNSGEDLSPFTPVGPPGENHYTSLQTAQPLPQNAPGLYPNQNGVQILDLQNRLSAMTVEQHTRFLMANQQNVQQPLRINSQPGQQISPSNVQQPLRINPQTGQQTSAPNVQPPIIINMQTGEQVPVGPVVQSDVAPLQPNPAPRVYQNPGPNSTPAVDNLPSLPEYPMSNIPRGWCVIINNRDFKVTQNDSESKEMPQRTGTDVDAESLQHVFQTLGFVVRRRDNLSETQMMQFLIDVAHNVDHTNFDCFVCCILTHGVLNHLYGTNGKLISIKDLTSMFQANRCPTLTGKPKLFFLQACQGRDKMSGGEQNIERDAGPIPLTRGNLESDADLQTDGKEMIPNEADFVIGYATVPGYVSFRSRTHGSWYIRKLCELLEKHSHRDDLMSILVQVNNEVSKANASIDNGTYKQTPAPLVTLRKKLYFR